MTSCLVVWFIHLVLFCVLFRQKLGKHGIQAAPFYPGAKPERSFNVRTESSKNLLSWSNVACPTSDTKERSANIAY